MKHKFRVLPKTSWTAGSFWSFEFKPLAVLLFALTIMGFGEGLLLLSNFGSAPWTVLSQGVALQGHFSVGWASLIISCLVMLMWFPLKLRVGIGTLLNIVVIALLLGATTAYMPQPETLGERLIYALIGILLFGVGSAFYLTAHQGAGPRDGLMVGLCYRFRLKIGTVRTVLEVGVCALGFLLGGTVGIGTLFFAFSIGWIMQLTLSAIVFLHRFVAPPQA
ncbi:YczE/YyaS/YitT family protein [Caviibacterium pharyngocola]|uniref:YitT family protein n=1 Tax=Caviibacterium pharyngocola TaxID=28159 RepID=A0A2M8RXV0_9PAST|nr:YitT family protein [Caviibacterium pharyngocola]PJG83706.1 hypothetical protein CVP04_02575 [Caviibacterium pharyngocola]